MIALSDQYNTAIQVKDKTNRPSSRSHTFRYFFCSNLRGNGNLLLFDFVGEWKPDSEVQGVRDNYTQTFEVIPFNLSCLITSSMILVI